MRVLTIFMGALLVVAGVFCVANAGISFISVAFLVGIVLMMVGIVEYFSYKSSKSNEEAKHWLLIEGITTFILGVVVLTNRLAADIAVPVVFGMWIMISGIRGLVIIVRDIEIKEEHKKTTDFYWVLIISILCFILGLYTFYNQSLLNISVLMMIGAIFTIQGANVIRVGLQMNFKKPDFLKSKEEKVAEATYISKKARVTAKEAIKAAKRARSAIRKAEESSTTEELLEALIEEEEEKE